MKRGILLLLLVLAIGIVASTTAYARPFSPGYLVHTQADGSKIIVSMAGSDEYVRFATTTDGYTLLDDGKGNLVYAVLDAKGNLVPTKIKAHDVGKRGASERALLGKLAKGLKFSAGQLKKVKPQRTWNKPTPYSFPFTGSNLKQLVIAVDFDDYVWSTDMQTHINGYNQQGYQSPVQGQTGSFKDFQKENSYNTQIITTTMVGPYRMPHLKGYYNTGDLLLDAVNAAHAAGVNFREYDNDNNGWCDPIGVVFAGYCSQYGGSDPNNLVECDYSIYCCGDTIPQYNNVWVCVGYQIAELRGSSGNEVESVAAATHEFGHNMWLNDTYHSNPSLMNCWDQMAKGSWGGGMGDEPSHHGAYGKKSLGWTTPMVLTTSGNGKTLQPAETTSNSFQLNTINPGEYFLLENRQQTGFDLFTPGHGLIVTHHGGGYECSLVNADNDSTCTSVNQAGDPFPGTTSNTSVTEDTTPNLKTWGGARSGNAVTNIAENSGVISFDFTKTAAPNVNRSCDSATVTTGTLKSGTHANTHASDNSYMVATAASVSGIYTAQETYTYNTGITGTLVFMQVVVEASVSKMQPTQTVYLWNPNTSAWVSLGDNTITNTDSTVTYTIANPNNYKTATGDILVSLKAVGGNSSFDHKVDFINVITQVQQ